MATVKTPKAKKKAAEKRPKNERNPKHRESFNDLLDRAAAPGTNIDNKKAK